MFQMLNICLLKDKNERRQQNDKGETHEWVEQKVWALNIGVIEEPKCKKMSQYKFQLEYRYM